MGKKSFPRPRFLLSNDDGVHAKGLAVLAKYLNSLGDVFVVAPLEEWSTCGHSLTLHKPLRTQVLPSGWMGTNGSPADCIYLGLRRLFDFSLKNPPTWVISGINRGANLGQDLYYSGTVSAAREACIWGIPSMAVSLAVRGESLAYYETAAHWTCKILKQALAISPPSKNPPRFWNLNVPNLPLAQIKGARWTQQGVQHYRSHVLKRMDHRDQPYYWIGGTHPHPKNIPHSDGEAVAQGYISLTPLQLDATGKAETLHSVSGRG